MPLLSRARCAIACMPSAAQCMQSDTQTSIGPVQRSAAPRYLHRLEPRTLRLAAVSSAGCASCCLHARYSSSACTCAALRFFSNSRQSTACWSCCTCVVRSWTFACSTRRYQAGIRQDGVGMQERGGPPVVTASTLLVPDKLPPFAARRSDADCRGAC